MSKATGFALNRDENNRPIQNSGQSMKYQAAAAANVVAKASAGFLERIIVGADVGSSVIEVSDHATDGDGNVKIYLAGDTLKGVYEVNAEFSVGISADLTNQTHVTFIYR
jgi:hypothetical protein